MASIIRKNVQKRSETDRKSGDDRNFILQSQRVKLNLFQAHDVGTIGKNDEKENDDEDDEDEDEDHINE